MPSEKLMENINDKHQNSNSNFDQIKKIDPETNIAALNEINEERIGYFITLKCDHNEEYSDNEKRYVENHLMKVGIIDKILY